MCLKLGEDALGCLCIDETPSGISLFCEAGGEAIPADAPEAAGLWERLQIALQQVRSRGPICGIVSRGTACAAALALAEQLPVDRLVLFTPRLSPHRPTRAAGAGARQLRRIATYARRNLSLCVADTLIVEWETAPVRVVGWSRRCPVRRLALPESERGKMYTIREIASKRAISCFLHTGELPKTLAQNSEMCIIDG